MIKSTLCWQPSEDIKRLMYKDHVTPEELKDAIIDYWHWTFGNDSIYEQMLKTQFSKQSNGGADLSKDALAKVIDNIQRITSRFNTPDVTNRSISRLHVLVKRCIDQIAKEQNILISNEDDIVIARNAGFDQARSIGFHKTDSVKIATVISELARNIVRYAGSGNIFITQQTPINGNGTKGIKIVSKDNGPGIDDVDLVFSGKYRSKDGLGIGLLGTKRLVDDFSINTGKGQGTEVVAIKYLA